MNIPNFESFELNEAGKHAAEEHATKQHAFQPGATAMRLKRREQQNIERFRAAQERGDNYGVTYYKYRIAIDKIDIQKLKLQTQIHQLKQTKK